MNRRLLLVEDDEVLRKEYGEFFLHRRYDVICAADGQEALGILIKSSIPFDAMILDLLMPNMSGNDLLRAITEKVSPQPPIIVLSAHFDEHAVALCLRSGVKCLFSKPLDLIYIEKAVDAIVRKDDTELWSLAINPKVDIRAVTFPNTVLFRLSPELEAIVESQDPIGSMVSRRESALRAFFLDRTNHPKGAPFQSQEGLFIVARRWNSWYPSFFNVPGGCYALTAPRNESGHSDCVIIDPGFRCLRVLASLGISVQDIGTCVLSHNHPDHIAGIFEFMSSRHALGLSTKGWCNRTTLDMFGDCSGFALEMNELSTTMQSSLFSYPVSNNKTHKVLLTGFPTAHREIGRVSASMGLTFSCCVQDPFGDRVISKGVVLGDTEYNRADHHKFIDILTAADVRFVVLHLGSAQVKQREGGHLYYPGLKRILTDMEAALERRGGIREKMPVLLSEWGLEHATKLQVKEICGIDLIGFDDRSPMVETANRLNSELHTLYVLPADIGLAIGLETGHIYLPNGNNIPAEGVRAVMPSNGVGLEYKELP